MRFIAAIGLLGFLAVAFALLGLVSTLPVNNWLEDGLVSWLDQPVSVVESAQAFEFEVMLGESADEIARRLEKEGLIRTALSFSVISRLRAADTALEAGIYGLRPNMTVSTILAELGRGRSRTVRVTLREGLRIAEVADALAANSVITDRDRFVQLATGTANWVEDITGRPPSAPLEGYLFPDTYEFELDQPSEVVIGQMIENFLVRVDEDLRAQGQTSGQSLHSIVTLASIVEKEAVLPAERPIIAAVFLNRLERSIPLGADPTVQYALVSDDEQLNTYWKIELTGNDLRTPSPYNTRLSSNLGLPPGPICSPGLASIQAVLNPADTDAIYFVARPDGSHAFAQTLEEHNINVRRYQR